jgi:hypothetical protein
MSQGARKAGLSRENLYKALSGERTPGFDTILNGGHSCRTCIEYSLIIMVMQSLHEPLKPYARSIPCGELWMMVSMVTLMRNPTFISGLPHKGISLGCLSPMAGETIMQGS